MTNLNTPNTTSTQPAHDFPKIGQPATRALLHAGYTHLSQLANISDKDLLALHGFGPKALGIIRATLARDATKTSSS